MNNCVEDFSQYARIYVPSKGRPKNIVANLFLKENIPATFVVEKEEYLDYKKNLPDLFDIKVLPRSGCGLSYSRHWILSNSNERFISMFDDDIRFLGLCTHIDKNTGFRIYDSHNTKKCIQIMFNTLIRNELGAAGCEYPKYSYARKASGTMKKAVEGVFFIDKENIKDAQFDCTLKSKEDRDFSLQLLTKGVKIWVSFDIVKSPAKGKTSSGGCLDMYKNGAFAEAAYILQKKWGKELVRVVKEKDGTIDDRINFRWFTGEDVRIDSLV